MVKRRIFTAIELPDSLKNTAEFYLEPFFREADIRIPEKDGWHITVNFMGYLNETEILEIQRVLDGAVSRSKAFELVPFNVQFVPEDRPRMVWMSFKKSPEFEKLRKEIEVEISQRQKKGLFRGFRLEQREASPHVTLARFEPADFRKFKKFLPDGGIDISAEAGPIKAESINMMESRLSPQGAAYQKIFSVSLMK